MKKLDVMVKNWVLIRIQLPKKPIKNMVRSTLPLKKCCGRNQIEFFNVLWYLRGTIIAYVAEVWNTKWFYTLVTFCPTAAHLMCRCPYHLSVMSNLWEIVMSPRSVSKHFVLQIPRLYGEKPVTLRILL